MFILIIITISIIIVIVIYRTWVGVFEVTMYWGLDMWFGGWRFGSCRG